MQAFPTTRWTMVYSAGGGAGDAATAHQALSQLLMRYSPALRAHLRFCRGLNPQDAEDLLQEFIAGHVLEQNLLARADRERGRFRTFLLVALDHHLSKQIRYRSAAKRSPGSAGHVQIEQQQIPDAGPRPSDVFDVAWAREVIREALERMRAECEASSRPDLWALFHGRVVAPAYDGVEGLPYEQIMARFGFRTLVQATNALVTAKRLFARMLRAVVAEYAEDTREVDDELLCLRQILAASRAE